MKSKGSYISSFIITLIFVFTLIASVGCITADKFASSQNLLKLTEEKEINNVVHKELEKYFSEKYADTGIPVEVHMKSINQEYLSMVIKNRIDYGTFNDTFISDHGAIYLCSGLVNNGR